MRPERAPPFPIVLAGAILLGIVLVGVALRVQDPLSGPLAAEDPYTHVVFTKEILEKGHFGDSFYLGTAMYPPGIHAFSGAFSPLAGVRLYDLAVWAPVALGAVAIVGTYCLANRLGGPVAGLAGALLVAVMPEHVFRTNLFAPTAFDLALLPAWMMLFVLAVTPRSGEPAAPRPDASSPRFIAAVSFVGLAVPIAFLHPWAIPLFAAPLAIFAALRELRTGGAPREVGSRLATAAILVVVVSAFAMASRWDRTDTGFAGFLDRMVVLSPVAALELAPVMLFAVLACVLGVLAAAFVVAGSYGASWGARVPLAVRRGVAVALAFVLVAAVVLLSRDLPLHVEYFSQFHTATVLLGMAGLVAALVAPTRLGDLGLALTLVLFPLTAINVFDSAFWPERTVIYLAMGVTLLAANLVAWAFSHAVRVVTQKRSTRLAIPVAILASVLLVGGAVAAKPAPTYPWYRLYSGDHFAGFERATQAIATLPDAQIVVYSWEPALVVKTLAAPSQARFSPGFFTGEERDAIVGEDAQHPRFVLVEKVALKKEREGKLSLSFLEDEGRYSLVYRSADGGFRLYEVKG